MKPTSSNEEPAEPQPLRIRFYGDVVGKPGRQVLKASLDEIREAGEWPDLVIVNGENAAAGSGLSKGIVRRFVEWDVDVITSGDHIFKNRNVVSYLEKGRFPLLRPHNYAAEAPGKGFIIRESTGGTRVGVMNLVGRVFMDPADCPFKAADRILAAFDAAGVDVRILDFHAEATSEMIAMGRYLAGRVSAVLGTHTHVATADEQILEGGTAFISDVGMTGPYDSVLGRRVEPVLNRMVHGRPNPFPVAKGDPRAAGVDVTVDAVTGRALSIERFMTGAEQGTGNRKQGTGNRE